MKKYIRLNSCIPLEYTILLMLLLVQPPGIVHAQSYCTPAPGGGVSYIQSVTTTLGIMNISSASADDGYTDYTGIHKVSVFEGGSVDFSVGTVVPPIPFPLPISSNCKIWVDWNQDGDFTDAGEEVYAMASYPGALTFGGSITAPAGALLGTTRMRISTDADISAIFGAPPIGPCVNTAFGEVEDYAFEIIAAIPCDDPGIIFPAAALASSTPAAVCGTGDIRLDIETAMPMASGITYQWQQSSVAAGPWMDISTDLLYPPLDVTGISTNTYFRCVIKCMGTDVLTTGPLLVESIVPADPVLNEGATCGSGTVELTGDGVGTIYWFEEATGGVSIGSGDTFITPEISTTTTFYAAAGAFPPAEIQIGTGTGSSYEEAGAPFGLGYPSSTGQFLYTASQLIDAGASAGLINAFSMNLTSLPGFPIPNYTVSIKQIPASMTTLTWQTTGFTTVFGGTGYTFSPTATGWQAFPFDTDFYWDGVSNIVIQFCYGAAAGTSFEGTYEFTPAVGQTLIDIFLTGTSACGEVGLYDLEQLPNIIFNFPGCVSDRIPVLAHVRDVPAVNIPIVDGEYCVFNNVYNIPSTPEQPEANTYRWNTGAVDSFITVGPSSGTEVQYWVEVTNEWGCTASDTVNLVLNPSPEVNLGPDTLICEDGSVVLDAGATGMRYYWNTGETTATIEADNEGTYSVLVTNEYECMATDTINVIMEGQSPIVENIMVDNLATYTFMFTPLHPEHTIAYAWDFGDGSPVSTAEVPTHTYTEPGTYLVTLTVFSDCGNRQYTAYTTIFTSADEPELDKGDVNIYPNPSSGHLTVETYGNKIGSLVVLNGVGQAMLRMDAGNREKYLLNVSMLPAGMYLLKIDTEKGIVVKKFQRLQ